MRITRDEIDTPLKWWEKLIVILVVIGAIIAIGWASTTEADAIETSATVTAPIELHDSWYATLPQLMVSDSWLR